MAEESYHRGITNFKDILTTKYDKPFESIRESDIRGDMVSRGFSKKDVKDVVQGFRKFKRKDADFVFEDSGFRINTSEGALKGSGRRKGRTVDQSGLAGLLNLGQDVSKFADFTNRLAKDVNVPDVIEPENNEIVDTDINLGDVLAGVDPNIAGPVRDGSRGKSRDRTDISKPSIPPENKESFSDFEARFNKDLDALREEPNAEDKLPFRDDYYKYDPDTGSNIVDGIADYLYQGTVRPFTEPYGRIKSLVTTGDSDEPTRFRDDQIQEEISKIYAEMQDEGVERFSSKPFFGDPVESTEFKNKYKDRLNILGAELAEGRGDDLSNFWGLADDTTGLDYLNKPFAGTVSTGTILDDLAIGRPGLKGAKAVGSGVKSIFKGVGKRFLPKNVIKGIGSPLKSGKSNIKSVGNWASNLPKNIKQEVDVIFDSTLASSDEALNVAKKHINNLSGNITDVRKVIDKVGYSPEFKKAVLNHVGNFEKVLSGKTTASKILKNTTSAQKLLQEGVNQKLLQSGAVNIPQPPIKQFGKNAFSKIIPKASKQEVAKTIAANKPSINTLGEQLSSKLSSSKFNAEIDKFIKLGRKSGILSDGTRVKAGKSGLWQIFAEGGKISNGKSELISKFAVNESMAASINPNLGRYIWQDQKGRGPLQFNRAYYNSLEGEGVPVSSPKTSEDTSILSYLKKGGKVSKGGKVPMGEAGIKLTPFDKTAYLRKNENNPFNKEQFGDFNPLDASKIARTNLSNDELYTTDPLQGNTLYDKTGLDKDDTKKSTNLNDLIYGAATLGMPFGKALAEEITRRGLKDKIYPNFKSPELNVGSVRDIRRPDFSTPYNVSSADTGLENANRQFQLAQNEQSERTFDAAQDESKIRQEEAIRDNMNKQAMIDADIGNRGEQIRAGIDAQRYFRSIGTRDQALLGGAETIASGAVQREYINSNERSENIKTLMRAGKVKEALALMNQGRRKKGGKLTKFSNGK